MASEVREPPKNLVTDFPISGGSTQDQFSLPPVGAILQENWQNWENLGVSPWVVSILRHGYKLSLQSNPPLQSVPAFFKPPESLAKRKLLQEEIKALQNKKAIELIQPGKPAFWSRMFLVPKTGNQWRPIIDLSILNQYLRAPKFHMETPESIRLAIQPNDWAISIDLADAYLHIPIHRDHRKYLAFAYQNQVWQFSALAFGLSPAPWIFTRVVEEVKKIAQKQGLIVHQYLDDWLVRSRYKKLLVTQAQWLMHLCNHLGLQVNLNKSELTPTSISDRKAYCRYPSQRWGGTISRPLCLEAQKLWLWAHKRNIIIRARHIPGKLNVLADTLSREGQIITTEWSLCPQIFHKLC